IAKFVPSPSQRGPSGNPRPGQTSTATELHLPAPEVGDELDVAPPQSQDLVLDGRLELARELAAKPEQAAVEGELLLVELPGELRAQKGLLGLRVGQVAAAEGGEALELLPAAFARGSRDCRVDVVGEELERVLLRVFLAHEEE